MKASELIAELARCIAYEGDREVDVRLDESDGYNVTVVGKSRLTYVTDRTYPSKPIQLVARKSVPSPTQQDVEEGAARG